MKNKDLIEVLNEYQLDLDVEFILDGKSYSPVPDTDEADSWEPGYETTVRINIQPTRPSL